MLFGQADVAVQLLKGRTHRRQVQLEQPVEIAGIYFTFHGQDGEENYIQYGRRPVAYLEGVKGNLCIICQH